MPPSHENFCHRARKYLGAYLAVLGGADAVLFSGGIGDNSPEIRARICTAMEWCGLRVDPKLNKARIGTEGCISPPRSKPAVYVVPVDEEQVIGLEARRLITATR